MREAALRYAEYFREANVDKIVSLFAPDAWIEDPVGQGVHKGEVAIRKFFQGGFYSVNGEIMMRPEGAVRVAEREVACAMIATCSKDDPPFWMETLDVWTFNDDGLFTSMRAYWGPSNFHPLEAKQ
jgi:steroid delta-isomerase